MRADTPVIYREYVDSDRALLSELSSTLSDTVKAMDPLSRIRNETGYAELELENLLATVRDNRGKIWFAQVDGKTAGYVAAAIWTQSEKNRLEIGSHLVGEVLDLYVVSGMRGQGIGSGMLALAEAYLKEEGCDSFWITVFAPNAGAHRLYERFGFTDRETGMLKRI